MKNKLLLLLKTSIRNNYKLSKMSKKKIGLLIMVGIYLVSAVFISLGIYLNGLFKTLNEASMTNYYIVTLFACASLFAFIFSIFSAKNGLFGNKDNDLLFSMPINREDILKSRFILIAGYNFVIGLMFIVPGIYIYCKNITPTPQTILYFIILTAFFAIIPTIISSIFGYFVAWLSSKAKNQSLVELFTYAFFIAAYLGLVYGGNGILEYLVSNPDVLNSMLKILFLPLYLILKCLDTGNILYLCGNVIINIGLLYLFFKIFNISYLKIISKLSSHKTTSKFKMKDIGSKSKSSALLHKEFRKYFGSAIYVFNTIIGGLIILASGVSSLIVSSDKLVETAGFESMSSTSLVLLVLVFSISLTITTNSTISIERNNFWIMKMLPVSTKEIFAAKVNLNRIMNIPACLISLLFFKIGGYIDMNSLLLLCLLTITYGSFIPYFGLIVNLMLPKLDAINDTVIVKQSAASMIGIFGGLFFFLVTLLFANSSAYTINTFIIISIIVSLILCIISKIILSKWGEKRFLEIN